VLATIAASRAALEDVIARCDERKLSEPRDAAGWAVKDHLIHLAVWERSMVVLFNKRPRYEAFGIDRAAWEELDADGINAVVFEREKNRSAAGALEMFRAAHEEMLATLGRLSFDDLQRPYAEYQPDEPADENTRTNPAGMWLYGNTAGHFDEHRGWIEEILRRDRG
jgi:hypothetical protein